MCPGRSFLTARRSLRFVGRSFCPAELVGAIPFISDKCRPVCVDRADERTPGTGSGPSGRAPPDAILSVPP